jgi:hypothetical protein
MLAPSEALPEVNIRCWWVYKIRYRFADASGKGFGSTILGKDGTRYHIGIWDKDTEEATSNYQEFENLVEALEEEAAQGNLKGAKIFLCMDNSTLGAALYQGTSLSEKLFELVVRVRMLEMSEQAQFLVSHVSGLRMIAEGADGTSRGQLKEGVLVGLKMLDFIPLKPWLLTWMGTKTEFLMPEGWFTRGQDLYGGCCNRDGFWQHKTVPGHFVWALPPVAADVALEEL